MDHGFRVWSKVWVLEVSRWCAIGISKLAGYLADSGVLACGLKIVRL